MITYKNNAVKANVAHYNVDDMGIVTFEWNTENKITE